MNTRTVILLAIVALVVAYVRTSLQYDHGWESLGDFALSWFIHYLAVWVFAAIAGAIVLSSARFFVGSSLQGREPTANEVVVYVALTLLVGSVVVFLLAYWPVGALNE